MKIDKKQFKRRYLFTLIGILLGSYLVVGFNSLGWRFILLLLTLFLVHLILITLISLRRKKK